MSFNEVYISFPPIVKRITLAVMVAALLMGAWTSQAASVAFVNRAARVDFSLFQQAGVCPANPELVTSCFVYGNQVTGPNRNMPVVVSFPYDAGCIDQNFDGICDPGTGTSFDTPNTHTLMVAANQVGSTWGIAYQGTTQSVFVASFLKHTH